MPQDQNNAGVYESSSHEDDEATLCRALPCEAGTTTPCLYDELYASKRPRPHHCGHLRKALPDQSPGITMLEHSSTIEAVTQRRKSTRSS